MMVVGGVSMHHYGNTVSSSTTTATALEQTSSAARVSAADKFNEWWSKLHKVQGNIIKLKNEADEKADQEVHTISVSLEPFPLSSAPPPSPLRWAQVVAVAQKGRLQRTVYTQEVKDLIRQLSSKWPSEGDFLDNSDSGTEAPSTVDNGEDEGDDESNTSPEVEKSTRRDGGWSYGNGPDGPSMWGDLSSDYYQCSLGKKQSPISIEAAEGNDSLPSVAWVMSRTGDFKTNAKSSIKALEGMNKQGLIVKMEDGPSMVVDDKKYSLEDIIVHTPAEHIIHGKRAAAEVQFMHRATKEGSERLGVAVFLDAERAKDNVASMDDGFLGTILSDVSKGHTDHVVDVKALSREVLVGTMPDEASALADFSPNFRSYYKYQGSLTAPPCTEGVTWVVLKNHLTVDGEKLDVLQNSEILL